MAAPDGSETDEGAGEASAGAVDGPAGHDEELAALADLHGAHVDDCVRVARLVLGDGDRAHAAAVRAFVLTHRSWYATEDRTGLLWRSLVKALGRALRGEAPRPVEPLLAAFGALPPEERVAAALHAVAGLEGAPLALALGTDVVTAEQRSTAGLGAVASDLAPGTDAVARARALGGADDADATLLAVLQGVTHQVHVRSQPAWVLVGLAVGVVLLLVALLLGVDWSGGDDEPVRITGEVGGGTVVVAEP